MACAHYADISKVERFHWPGPKFVQALVSGRPMKAKRPRHFFRDDGPMRRFAHVNVKPPPESN